jgi:predicted secreted Zn-dependent protease
VKKFIKVAFFSFCIPVFTPVHADVDRLREAETALREVRKWETIWCNGGCSCRGDRCAGGGSSSVGDTGGGIGGTFLESPAGEVFTIAPVYTVPISPGLGLQCLAEAIGLGCNEPPLGNGETDLGNGKPPKILLPKVHFPTAGNPKVAQYDISGYSWQEVFDRLNTTLSNKYKAPAWGLTQGKTTWSFNYDELPDNGGFILLSVTGSTDITIEMPYWIEKENVLPSCLSDGWDKMYSSLSLHEQGHVDIIGGFEKLLQSKLASINKKHYDTKELLKEAVQSAHDDAIKEIQALHDAYDDKTHKGKDQGVVFDNCGPVQ